MTRADDLLTAEQVAELANVSPGSIHRYKTRGTIPEPTRYYGRTPVWSRKVVDEWLANRRGPGRPPAEEADQR